MFGFTFFFLVVIVRIIRSGVFGNIVTTNFIKLFTYLHYFTQINVDLQLVDQSNPLDSLLACQKLSTFLDPTLSIHTGCAMRLLSLCYTVWSQYLQCWLQFNVDVIETYVQRPVKKLIMA